MTMTLEKTGLGAFQYERIRFQSKALGSESRFGRLKLAEHAAHSPETLLYFFHGGNGDDRQFVDAQLFQLIQGPLLEKFRSSRIEIILPWIGTSFLHGKHGESFRSEVMPLAESGLSKPPKRLIAGLSMGGEAALSEFFAHPSKYSAAGANFPTTIDFDFLDEAETRSYASRNQVDPAFLEILLREFRSNFSSRDEARAHGSLARARSVDASALRGKPIYFDVGTRDGFGLQEGCTKLDQALTERGIAHEHHLIEGGGHDPEFLIARLPRLLEALTRSL